MSPSDPHPPAATDASGDESPPPSGAARQPRRKRRRKSRSGGRGGAEPRKAAPVAPAAPEEVARLKAIDRRAGDLPEAPAGIIRRRLSGARRLLDEGRSAGKPLAAIERDLTRMLDARSGRMQRRLDVTYPAELPVSLARDVSLLAEAGYVPERIEVLDLFPNTHHVETVTRFVPSGS